MKEGSEFERNINVQQAHNLIQDICPFCQYILSCILASWSMLVGILSYFWWFVNDFIVRKLKISDSEYSLTEEDYD